MADSFRFLKTSLFLFVCFSFRDAGETARSSDLETVVPYHPHEWCFSVCRGQAGGNAVVGCVLEMPFENSHGLQMYWHLWCPAS